MKNQKPNCTLLWLLLLLAAFLTACGDKDERSYVYVAEKIPIPVRTNDLQGFKTRNGYFYYYQGNKVYRFSVADLAGKKSVLPKGKVVFAGDDADSIISAYTLDEEECGYYTLCYIPWWTTEELSSFVLIKQQSDGMERYRLDLKELNIDNIASLAVDGEGRIFLLTEDFLWVIDAEGKIVAQIPGSKLGAEFYGYGGRLLEGEDGSIYYSPSDYIDAVYEVSGSDEAFRSEAFQVKRIQFPCTTGKCYSASQGLLCAGKDGMLYQYRKEESKWETVLNFGDSNLQMQPYQMIQFSEDWMAAYYNDTNCELYFLTKTDTALLPERDETELVLVTSGLTKELEQFIAEFNQTSGYHITVRYYQGPDRVEQLNAQMVSSNPPDLIDLEDVTALLFSEKGMLEDLAPYLDASTVLDRQDFLENLLDGYTLNGRLVCIPDTFCVETTVGRASQIGAQTVWTKEEVIDFVEEHQGAQLFRNPTFSSMVAFFTKDILERYINWENGESKFDEEEFSSFVKWMKEHSDGFGQGAPFYFNDGGDDKIIPDEELLRPQRLVSSFEDLLRSELCFEEEISAIGYPTLDGSPYYPGTGYNTVGITVNCKDKEAAWKFLEAFLSRENRINGLPSRKELLEKNMKAATTPNYQRNDDGEISVYQAGENKGEPVIIARYWFPIEEESVPYYYITEDQADIVMEVIKNADFTPRYGGLQYQIISILLEELGPYIDGQKTLEECTRILQNRVQNLVQENL